MFGIHGWELVIVLLIFVVLFGKRIPGVARSLGQSLMEFKKGIGEGQKADQPNDSQNSASTRTPNAGDGNR